jgi:hypothetical protein
VDAYAQVVQAYKWSKTEPWGAAIRLPDRLTGAWFDPTGTRVALACGPSSLFVAILGLETPAGFKIPIWSQARTAAFSPDARRLAVALTDGLAVFDAQTGDLIAYLPGPPADTLAFLPDGRALLVSGPGDAPSRILPAADLDWMDPGRVDLVSAALILSTGLYAGESTQPGWVSLASLATAQAHLDATLNELPHWVGVLDPTAQSYQPGPASPTLTPHERRQAAAARATCYGLVRAADRHLRHGRLAAAQSCVWRIQQQHERWRQRDPQHPDHPHVVAILQSLHQRMDSGA